MEPSAVSHMPQANAGRSGWRTFARSFGALLTFLPLAAALTRGAVTDDLPMTISVVAILSSFGVMGFVLSRRRPGNAIGWVFLSSAALGATWVLSLAVVTHGDAGATSFVWAAWANTSLYFPWIASAVAIPLVLFPTGRPDGRIGTFVLWAAIGTVATSLLVGFFHETITISEGGPPVVVDNPLGFWGGSSLVLDLILFVSPVLLAVGMLGAPLSMVLRFRNASPIERLQIKGVAYTASVAAVSLLSFYLIEWAVQPAPAWTQALVVIGLGGLFGTPVMAGLAVIRYRLYDIDRLISRTLSYTALAALLAATYFGSVAAVASVVTSESDSLAVAAATLATAALFNPLRKRLQRAVDRRFFRADYDAATVASEVSRSLQGVVEVNGVRHALLDALADTVQPETAAVWIRPPRQ